MKMKMSPADRRAIADAVARDTARPTATHYALRGIGTDNIVVDDLPTRSDAFAVGEAHEDADGLEVVAVLDNGRTVAVGPVDPFVGLS